VRVLCRIFGHRFETFDDGFKRRCPRCDREEWMMSRPYPRVGEAKYFWEDMGFDEFGQRSRAKTRRP
jgi:hypothetical protein